MGDPKSLAAEIEAVILRYFPRSTLGDAAYGADRQTNCAAEIAALQSRAFEDRALMEATEVHDQYGNDVERVLRDHLGTSCNLSGASQTEVAQHTARSILFALAEANRIAAFKRMDRTALAPNTTEGRTDRA